MYDCVIIGSGPAGYSAAIRAGQLGMKTVLIERAKIGGMCLNWGCVPARVMLESARVLQTIRGAGEFGIDFGENAAVSFSWKRAVARTGQVSEELVGKIGTLLSRYGVEIIEGEGTVTGPGSVTVNNRNLETKAILIATGSVPENVPKSVRDTASAGAGRVIELKKLFGENSFHNTVAVYGAGPVAVEISQIFALLGKKVTLIAQQEELLPGFDHKVVDALVQRMGSQGITVTGTLPPTVETVINCSLRGGVVPEMDPQCAITERGFIKVDGNFQTSVPGVYAAGDVTGLEYLAQAASVQAITAVNHMAGLPAEGDYFHYPLILYGIPEAAQAGLTESEVNRLGKPYKTAFYSFGVNGIAVSRGEGEGFVRILYEERFGEVLGVQIVGSGAADLIFEALAVIRAQGTVYDLAGIVHAHPAAAELFTDINKE